MTLKKEDCKKRMRGEPRDINVNIKVAKSLSKFMNKEELSPTAMLYNAAVELGYKDPMKKDEGL